MLVQRTLVCSIALAAALTACGNRRNRAQEQAQAQQAQAQAQAILNQQQAQMAALQAQNAAAQPGQAPNAIPPAGQAAANQAAMQGQAAALNAQMAMQQAMQGMQTGQPNSAQMQAAANQMQIAQMQAQAAMQNGMQAAAQAMNQAAQQMQQMPQTPQGGSQMGASRNARPIALGQTIAGTLTQATSTSLQDGSLGDDYLLSMTPGQQATIVVRGGPSMQGGGNLDAYVVVYFNGTEVGHDDDSAGNLNARYILTAAMPGVYTVRVTTYGGGLHQGAYTMSVLPGAIPNAM